MKLLIALFSVLTLNMAHAEMGSFESYGSPSLDKDGNVVHLYLQNNCYQDVFIATRGQNPNGVWETKGYMRVFPGQVLSAGDMTNNIFYLNAFTANGNVRWEGVHKFEINGRSVSAILVKLPKDFNGNWTTVLYCR